ncbi:MAG: VacB/RNase II family 3'-5' exoribonuclease [Armatimonadetes bacterium]|nr:VacB/RNase II family 3'-5' exoribonuclease [Armatimonadota bacterium]
MSSVAPGALVEYFQEKKILCGLCLKADKKSLHVLSEENREAAVPPQRVVLATPSFMNPAALREDVVARLRKESAHREGVKAGITLADLWELMAEEPGQYTIHELAAFYFSGTPESDQISGLLRALRDDRVYFERKSDLYVPHDRERMEQLAESIRAEERKEREREEMVRWLKSTWLRVTAPNGGPECLSRYLDWIKDVAVFANESSRFKEVQALLGRAGIAQNDGAFQVLVRSGAWSADENLLLHKNRVPREFPADVNAEAGAIVAQFRLHGLPEDASRTDLTHLHAVTIDDEHTVETDDALSIERIDEGWRVGVHIADPAAFMQPGSALDREALHRATSIYFPDLKIPMLPPVLGTEVCSLTAGSDRFAISLLADLDEAGNLLRSEIVESRIRVRERLTYDDVDAFLEEGREDLTAIFKLGEARRQRRRQSGAVFVPFPSVEVYVEIDEEGSHIDVRREEHDIRSHIVVSEFMILANEIVASFCRDREIPAVYRGQAEPTEPIEIGEVFTALHGFKIRRLLRKGVTSLDPIRHSGLGLDAYLQFTSPIRRYVDLAMHRQVKHYLRHGAPLYAREDMEKISTHIAGPVEQAELMERQRKAYWIFKHLEESLWAERAATVLQTFSDRYHVQLYDTLVETECPSVSGAGVSPGDRIQVKIELVWPREGVLRVSAVPPARQ